VIEMSPEWVTGPEKGKSVVGLLPLAPWTGVLWDGISSIPDETVVPL
jgi:hypothetical protein